MLVKIKVTTKISFIPIIVLQNRVGSILNVHVLSSAGNNDFCTPPPPFFQHALDETGLIRPMGCIFFFSPTVPLSQATAFQQGHIEKEKKRWQYYATETQINVSPEDEQDTVRNVESTPALLRANTDPSKLYRSTFSTYCYFFRDI